MPKAAEQVVKSVNVPAPAVVSIAPRPPAASEVLDDPDGWDVAAEVAPVALPVVAVAQPSEGSIQTATVDAPASAKATSQPAREREPRTGKSQTSPAVAKRAAASEPKLANARVDGPESELSGEFFAVKVHDVSHTEQFHETEDITVEFVDERHLRSISPEAIARRAKFRVLVWVVFVAFVLLLAAAIAQKYHLYRLYYPRILYYLHKLSNLHILHYLRKFFNLYILHYLHKFF